MMNMNEYTPSNRPIDSMFEILDFIKSVSGDTNELLEYTPTGNSVVTISPTLNHSLTRIPEYLILSMAVDPTWVSATSTDLVGVYINHHPSYSTATQLIRTLRDIYESSEYLQKFLPIATFNPALATVEFTNVAEATRLHFSAFDRCTAARIRGFKRYGQRPKVAILDNFVKSEDGSTMRNLDAILCSLGGRF